MATGVLVIGIEKATRLLGHLALTEKEYLATIRLGQATDTGDAGGTVVSAAPAGELTLARVRAAAASLTGEIQQVPPAVSAVKVGGRRAYQLAREGRAPVLAARAVVVHEFTICDPRPAGRRPAGRDRGGALFQRDVRPRARPRPRRVARGGRAPHNAAAHPGRPLSPRRRADAG